MFDLEKAIVEWRRQMRAAGIQTPMPLEELEGHLRDEIVQQMKSGLNTPQAFEVAVQRIGRCDALKTEFVKTSGFFDWLRDNKPVKTDRILGILWMAFGIYVFTFWFSKFSYVLFMPHFGPPPGMYFQFFASPMYLFGAVAGYFLFRGSRSGSIGIGIIALFITMVWLHEFFIAMPRMGDNCVGVFAIMSVSLLLFSKRHEVAKLRYLYSGRKV